MRISIVAGLLALVFVLHSAGQAPEPKVRLVYPQDGGYVSGEIVIKAALEPATIPVERMTFFVDGRQVCSVERPPYECAWNAGPGVREHTFRVVASASGGRRLIDNVRTKGVEFADAADVDMIQVTVSVMDGSTFVRGLKKEDFRVYEDDARQPIAYFAAENIPLELITAVDVSQSMTDAIEGVKENVKRFLSALRPTDRITLAGFNERFWVFARPSADLATRLKAVDRLGAWGTTSLYQIIIQSFDLLGKQQGRRGLVLFTDGEDTSSRVTPETVERRAETSDAVLYMIGQGQAIESRSLRGLCERLAQKSGGRAFFPRDDASLREAFDLILEELSNQYFLTYTPPSQARDARWHRLRVEVTHGHYDVRARQGYRFRNEM